RAQGTKPGQPGSKRRARIGFEVASATFALLARRLSAGRERLMLFLLSLYPASQFHYDPLPFSRRETRARNLIVIVPRLAAPSRAVRGARRLGRVYRHPRPGQTWVSEDQPRRRKRLCHVVGGSWPAVSPS